MGLPASVGHPTFAASNLNYNMKRLVNVLSGVFFIALIIFPGVSHSQSRTFTVSGTVIDSLTHEPIAGVYVTTDNNKGAQTDRNGRFMIKSVPAGRTTLRTMYFSDYSCSEREVDIQGDIDGLRFYITNTGLAIDQIVVTGTRTQKRLAETPILTTVIQEREIEKSASTSVLEALQDNIPGLIISENAMGNNLRLRGLTTRYVLFLVDGERLVGEGAGGNINLNQIDVNNIKRIEMINGAGSALYGSNAVGAVINIITKEPHHKFEGGLNASLESHNTWRLRAEAGSSTEKFSVRAAGFRNSSDGFDVEHKNSETGAIETKYSAEYEDYGADLKLKYNPIKRADIGVTGRYFSHETFNPANSMNVTHSLTKTFAAGASGGYVSSDNRNEIRGSFHFDKYFDYTVYEKKDKETKDNTASYISGRLVDTFKPTLKWELIAGAEFNHEETFATKTLGSDPTTKNLQDMNGFAQAEYSPIKDLDIIAGARYTYNTRFGSAFSPKLALKYDIRGFAFRGSIGSAFRAPSIKELYYDFHHTGGGGEGFWIIGNPDLKAEKGLYSSLSVEYTKGLFNGSVAGYYNDINNKITQFRIYNSDNGRQERHYKNVSSSTLKGFDVSLSYILFRELALRGSYSYCDAVDNSTGLQLEDNTKHSGTVSLTWNGNIAGSPFSIQFAGRLHSPMLYQTVSTEEDGSQLTTYSESKSYSIWKAVLVKPFRIQKHTIEFTFKVDNIFNFQDKSFTNPGTQFMVGLRYRFK